MIWNWRDREEREEKEELGVFPVLSVPLLDLGPLGGGSETRGWETILCMLAKHSLGHQHCPVVCMNEESRAPPQN